MKRLEGVRIVPGSGLDVLEIDNSFAKKVKFHFGIMLGGSGGREPHMLLRPPLATQEDAKNQLRQLRDENEALEDWHVREVLEGERYWVLESEKDKREKTNYIHHKPTSFTKRDGLIVFYGDGLDG